MYRDIERDHLKAMDFFQKAAKGGDVEAKQAYGFAFFYFPISYFLSTYRENTINIGKHRNNQHLISTASNFHNRR